MPRREVSRSDKELMAVDARGTLWYARGAMESPNPLDRVLKPLLMLIVILLAGTGGYMLLEKFTFLDTLYMVVITLSTVGFGEVRQLSPEGRILTIFLILAGVGTVGFAIGRLLEFVLEGHVRGFTRRRRMQRILRELEGHYIICGFGRVGHQIAEEFEEHGVPFVVVDNNDRHAEELTAREIPFVVGNVADDDVLEEAGIERAKGLVAAVDSDADNVFITLTARVLNPSIFIVSRSSDLDTEAKLRKAGANRVVSPYVIGGRRMASMALKPATIDFLDTIVKPGEVMLCIEELRLGENFSVAGKPLADSEIRQKAGAMVLAVKRQDGSFEFNPSPSYTIHPGDSLIVLGTKDQCGLLEKMI
ncbi:MAG: potassium channel protein [Candidatus Eisenbacteria bacterium]